ncbi:helix-turn-helix domain-containing protein [Brevibacterium moorei]|uniref:helix-turn-helix domain-containing protein n=1 Tax=Brevibacterium moorei TaxID=2968457 RepID=UPI00359C9E31
MSQTRLNAQSRAELLAAYSEGAPVQELAKRFGVHRGTVHALARRAGLRPRNGPELPNSVREEAARLYANGLTLLDAGRQLGISNDAVRAAVVSCGGTIRPKGRRPRVA